jgi:putative hydrolase of the HAD superfamily
VIEAVLFDFGGVVTTSPFEAFARYEAEQGLPDGLIRRINSTNPDTNAWAKLERSEVDRAGFAELFEAEGRALGHELSAVAVLACLDGRIRPQMVATIERLAAGPHKLGLLTNNLVGHDSPITGMEVVLDCFDAVVESSKVGVRKPEPRFYEIACELLAVAPSACVFLDDLGINLKPAAAMGMRTIKVVDPDVAIAELLSLLRT